MIFCLLSQTQQIGDSTNPEFLESLGADNFDVCIVTIGNDFQSSLETTSNLKELGARRVVSRAARDVHAKFLLRNGADEILYPEKQIAKWAAIRYASNNILDYIELDEAHAIFEVSVPREWIGLSIGQIDIRKKYHINIMVIKKDGMMNMGGHAKYGPDRGYYDAGAWFIQRFAEVFSHIMRQENFKEGGRLHGTGFDCHRRALHLCFWGVSYEKAG